jgi:deoxyribodipyrimidine photolyase-related protein
MTTVWILGDQLSPFHAGLQVAEKSSTVVLMMESKARGNLLRYHQQKLALVFSAMRHFAEDLKGAGWTVDYLRIEAGLKFEEGMRDHLIRHGSTEVLAAEPNSFIEQNALRALGKKLKVPLRLIPSQQFLCSREDFWAHHSGKKQLRMEHHYRRMRKATGYLMRKDDPEGGQWNYDVDNRLTFADWRKAKRTAGHAPPKLAHDTLTREVIAMVQREFKSSPGDATLLWVPVSRAEALQWLAHFITHRLARFGDFEDVMVDEEPVLYHSVLSSSLNLGLLTPDECVRAAIAAYSANKAPLNAVEGFVRQIIGWREFINGVYWLRGPAYKELNGLHATRPLPSWFYTGETPMRCLHLSLKQTLAMGWNHHIQRLMIIGNFMLLAGIRPDEALRWFLEMYIDAFDWVMAANVIGMICHADDGFVASKPYAAGGAYINRMSNYCAGCSFDPKIKSGPGACPYNFLYWNFYDQHATRFEKNPRTNMPITAWRKRSKADQDEIRSNARQFLEHHVPVPS